MFKYPKDILDRAELLDIIGFSVFAAFYPVRWTEGYWSLFMNLQSLDLTKQMSTLKTQSLLEFFLVALRSLHYAETPLRCIWV